MKFFPLLFLILQGEYALEFLKFGAGAREISLSNADIISPSPSVAPLYNPACIISERFLFTLNTSLAFNRMVNYNYAGFTLPVLKKYFLCIGFLYCSVPEIPLYPQNLEPGDTNFYKPEGYFNYTQKAFLFDFAWKSIPIGFNIKVIHQKMLEGKGIGIGFDAGTNLKKITKFGIFSLAIVLRDIGGTKISWKEKEEGTERTGYYFGTGYSKNINFLKFKIFGILFYDYDLYTSCGIETSIKDIVFLRTGFSYFDLFSAGAGIKLNIMEIDYGFKRNIAGSTHSISLTFKGL